MSFIDSGLFEILNRQAANPAFDAVFPFLTSLHQRAWFMAALGLGALVALIRGDRRVRLWAIAAIVAVGASDLLCSKVIKRTLARERPCQSVAKGVAAPTGFSVRVVNPDRCPGSQSFPSNHAANMMAVGSVCWWFTRRRARWAWWLLPLVIGYTRVYLGYHYPSDVMAGWLVGGCVAALALLGARHLLRDPG